MLQLLIFFALEISVDQIEAYYKDYDIIIHGSGEGVGVVYNRIIESFIMTAPYYNCDNALKPFAYCDPRVKEYVYTTAEIKDRKTYKKLFYILEREIFANKLRDRSLWRTLGFDVSDEFHVEGDNVIDFSDQYFQPFRSERYYNMAGLCFDMIDQDLGWWYEEIIRFCHFVYVPFHNTEIELFSESFAMHTTVKIGLKVKCYPHRFELSCWKYCQAIYARYSCDINGNQICQDYYDNIDFINKFPMPTFEYKYWIQTQAVWSKCILYNHCIFRMEAVFKKCFLNYQCYPLGNATYTCLIFKHTYIASKYSQIDNATFRSIVSEESVTIRIDLTGNDSDLVKSHSVCQWKIDVWDSKYYDINIASNASVLEFLSSAKHGNYSFIMECIIGRFRKFTMFPNYTLYISFKNFWLHNTSLGGNRSLFITQIIRCLSDAITESISQHHLMLESLADSYKLNKTFERTITIPLDIPLGIYIVTCGHTFIFPDGRPPVFKMKSMYVEIRSYVYLSWWRKYKNVYTIHDLAGCRYLAYFLGSLSVRKNKGIGSLNVFPPDNFSTATNVGGYYQFLCTLTVKEDEDMRFFKRIDFEIFYMPTKICILTFFPSPGSIIICSHNGYPADHAKYYVTLQINKRIIVSSKKNYIKIPYSIGLKTVAVWCSFNFFIHSNIETFKTHREFVVQPETTKNVIFTDSDFSCLANSGYQLDNLDIISYNEILISTERLILVVVEPNLCEMWLGMFMICILCGVSLIIFIRSDVQELVINLNMHSIRSRSLNDQLQNICKLAIEGHFDETVFFQFKLTNLSAMTLFKTGTKFS